MKRKLMSLLLIACMIITLPVQMVKADAVESDEKPYLSLGADLSSEQKQKVLELLGVDSSKLDDYTVGQVTNEEEHKYLGSYLSNSVIGTKALSSVLVTKTAKDSGITVDTHNITYCTATMYCNALTTAGIEDADVVVAGPFNITGTAALVGTIKAYSDMTGEEVSAESVDAATNELVLTGELGDALAEDNGDDETAKEDAGKLMALVKQKVVEDNLSSTKDIKDAIDDSCKELNLKLSDENKEKVAKLMGKISKLDLDTDTLKTQAKDLYNKLANLDIDKQGMWDKFCSFMSNLGHRIKTFFEGIF